MIQGRKWPKSSYRVIVEIKYLKDYRCPTLLKSTPITSHATRSAERESVMDKATPTCIIPT